MSEKLQPYEKESLQQNRVNILYAFATAFEADSTREGRLALPIAISGILAHQDELAAIPLGELPDSEDRRAKIDAIGKLFLANASNSYMHLYHEVGSLIIGIFHITEFDAARIDNFSQWISMWGFSVAGERFKNYMSDHPVNTSEKPTARGTINDLYNLVGVTDEDLRVRNSLVATQSRINQERGLRDTFSKDQANVEFITNVLRAYGVNGPLESDFFSAIPVRAIEMPKKLWEQLIEYAEMYRDPQRLQEIPQDIRTAAGL